MPAGTTETLADGTQSTETLLVTTDTINVGTPEDKPLNLTQAQLDKIIADRVKRAVPEDYEELRVIKEERDKAKEDEKTELQKAQDAAAEAKSEGKKALAKANARLLKAAILAEAAQAGALDSDIVVMALAGSDKITVDKDGEVIGAKEAVTAFLAEKPYLVKGKSGANGGEFGGNDGKTIAERIAALEATGTRESREEARRLKVQHAYVSSR